jgi:hypothetical protein
MAPRKLLEQATALFQDHTPLEASLRTGVTVFILAYVLFFGSVFEATYPTRIVELYAMPWWRLLVVGLVGIGAYWCPRVGLALAVAAFFYLNDMHILTSPFLNTPTK